MTRKYLSSLDMEHQRSAKKKMEDHLQTPTEHVSQQPPKREALSSSKQPGKSIPKIKSSVTKAPYKSVGTPMVNQEKNQEELRTPTEPALQRKPRQEAPATAPAVMQGKNNEREKAKTPKKAPASSGKPKKAPGSGAFSGMKSWLIKKLNPDAKECHLPESEEQPYYDEKIKRWVFPGDDPTELAKPLAPPPTMSKKEDEATKPQEPEKPKDAVMSMMAPPPSRIPGKKTPLRGMPGGMGSPMMMSGMMMPPGSGPQGMMSPPGFSGATPPKIGTFAAPKAAVFTPKPAAIISEESEAEANNDGTGEQE
mmetsp:Transcript_9010/g.21988  ORF Transcript_9010/g.21988 Transcript_9010/m.21988 type:complete len:309 (-) Transcript_9010:140-1066(-)